MELTTLPLDEIQEPKDSIREWISEEGLQELASSIRLRGILQPIRVRKNDNGYEIQDGHRRFLAAQRLGFAEVPCIIINTGTGENELDKIHANLGREDLSPLEISRHINLLHRKYGYSYEQLAELMGVGKSRISQLMTLNNLDPNLVKALEDKRIGERTARALNQVPDPDMRKYYLSYALDHGATVQTVERWAAREKAEAETQQKFTPEERKRMVEKVAEPLKIQCECCRSRVEPQYTIQKSICIDCLPIAQKVFANIRQSIREERDLAKSGETGEKAQEAL